MQEMIDERRTAEKKPERYDLFSSLLDANMEETEGMGTRLKDSELIGVESHSFYPTAHFRQLVDPQLRT